MNSLEYELMVSDNSKAPSPFKATSLVWENLCSVFRNRFDSEGVADIEDQSYNASFASYPRNDRRYERFARGLGITIPVQGWYESACQAYFDLLSLENFQLWKLVPLNKTSAKSSMAHTLRDGTKVTWDYLLTMETLITILRVKPQLCDQPLNIVDLGAGWGRLGASLLAMNPRLTYVIADIPESLIISQEYLPRHLEDTPFIPFSETRTYTSIERESLSERPGVWICGTQSLPRFTDKSIDLFLNVFSFQEMTLVQNEEYFRVIDRITKGGLFYNAQRVVSDVMTQRNYPYRKNWIGRGEMHMAFSSSYFHSLHEIR